MKIEVPAPVVPGIVAAFVAVSASACTGTRDIHDAAEARAQPCISCHNAAYAVVENPKHVGVFPSTCDTCHSTHAWEPAANGHPEAKFPVTTGSHSNPAIGCADCHVATLGSDTGGQNTDCVHCHIGAHDTPAIDAAHATVMGYPGPNPTAPNSCLGCHGSG